MMLREAGGRDALESFSLSLADLAVNSKPLITTLTGAAQENLPQAAAIVNTINNHLKKAPNVAKLPILYLIDSILKNVGGDYVHLFTSTLKENFGSIFKKADKSDRQAMYKLRLTWNTILSSEELCAMDIQVHAVDPDWPLTAVLTGTIEHTPLKILVNPTFLPHDVAGATSEDEDVEALREKLLHQMKKRKLEKERRRIELKDKAELNVNTFDAASSTQNEESSKSHADSTTVSAIIDKMPSVCGKENSSQSICRNSSVGDKQSSFVKDLVPLCISRDKEEFRRNDKHMLSPSLCSWKQEGQKAIRLDCSSERSRRKHSLEMNCYQYSKERERARYSWHKTTQNLNVSLHPTKGANRPDDISLPCTINQDNCEIVRKPVSSYSKEPSSSCRSTNKLIESQTLASVKDMSRSPLITPHELNIDAEMYHSSPSSIKRQLSKIENERQRKSPCLRSSPVPESYDLLSAHHTKEPSCVLMPNIETRDCSLEIKPLKDIDYKHGYGAPEKINVGDLNENNISAKDASQYPCKQPLPVTTSQLTAQNYWHVTNSVLNTCERYKQGTSVQCNTYQEHYYEENVRHSSVPNLFSFHKTMEGSMKNVMSNMTREIRVYSKIAGNVVQDSLPKTPNNPLSPFFGKVFSSPKVLKKKKKKRARFTERLRRNFARTERNLAAHKNNLCNFAVSSEGSRCMNISAGDVSMSGIMNDSVSHTTQPDTMPTSQKGPLYQPCVNVHALVENLCKVGLLTPECFSKEGSKDNLIHTVDFGHSLSLKKRQPGIVSMLHSGLQCNSCGVRTEDTVEFREHLDWHFQQNHSLRDSKAPQSRKWFDHRSQWINAANLGYVGETVVGATNELIKEECSVPSCNFPQDVVCEVCCEKFEEFFNEDSDEWQLKDCMTCEGLAYHPACFTDSKVSAALKHSRFNLLKKLNSIEHCDTKHDFCENEDGKFEVKSCGNDINNVLIDLSMVKSDKPCMTTSPKDKNPMLTAGVTEQPRNLLLSSSKPKEANSSENLSDENKSLNILSNNADEVTVDDEPMPVLCLSNVSLLGDSYSDCQLEEEIVETTLKLEEGATPDVDGIVVLEEHNLEESLPLQNAMDQLLNIITLKPKLVGRRLTQVPPVVKGSETSNLCCLS